MQRYAKVSRKGLPSTFQCPQCRLIGSCCQAAVGVFLQQPGSRGWKSGGAQKLKVGVTPKENMNQYLFPPIPTAVVIGINKYCFIFLLVVSLFFSLFIFYRAQLLSSSTLFHPRICYLRSYSNDVTDNSYLHAFVDLPWQRCDQNHT